MAKEINAFQDILQNKVMAGAKIDGKLWEDSHFLLADVPLDEGEVRRVLPMGLKPSNPPMATLFICDYRNPGFTVPYKESAVLIHVRSLLGEGYHCCWMPVDDDTALIYGRELLGYPKKMSDIVFEEDGDHISASVTRRGVKVLTMEGRRGAVQSNPPPIFDVKTFNVGGMGQFFAINLVWLFRPIEEIHESYEAEVTISIEESEYDPISRLVAGDAVRGRMAVIDILGAPYMFPVGITGVFWSNRNFFMRYR
jgi:acetoacetate decarboxylase